MEDISGQNVNYNTGIKAFPISLTYKNLYKLKDNRYSRPEMVKSLGEQILEEVNLNFFIQSIEEKFDDGTSYYKLKIQIKDKNGKEIEHIFKCPGDYSTQDVLKNIWKLIEYYKFAQNAKLEEAIKEEVLIWLALIIARVV